MVLIYSISNIYVTNIKIIIIKSHQTKRNLWWIIWKTLILTLLDKWWNNKQEWICQMMMLTEWKIWWLLKCWIWCKIWTSQKWVYNRIIKVNHLVHPKTLQLHKVTKVMFLKHRIIIIKHLIPKIWWVRIKWIHCWRIQILLKQQCNKWNKIHKC